jgi:hypothetical protein
MRPGVDKGKRVAWLPLKRVMGMKNRRPKKKKKCIKAKEVGDGGGKRDEGSILFKLSKTITNRL